MKKKHEIIKYAYENFPKGTLFRWYKGVAPFVSTGKFKFEFSDSNALFIDLTDDSTDAGVTVFDGHKWAEIVPEKKSILDGKVAIQVQNEREFKLLMEHYESKGWKWRDQSNYKTVITEEHFHTDVDRNIIQYNDKCVWMERINSDEYNCEKAGYTIIQFSDFAKETGIEVPVFIMKSEDGVDLYEGDKFWWAELINFVKRDEWVLAYHEDSGDKHQFVFKFNFSDSKVVTNHKQNKAFSTKQSAEKWIAEMNKPKFITVSKDSPFEVDVWKDKAVVLCEKSETHEHNIVLTGKEIEEIYAAYKSLQ